MKKKDASPPPLDEAACKSVVGFCTATLLSVGDPRIYLAATMAMAEAALRALALSAKRDPGSKECQRLVHAKLRDLLVELRPEDLQ